MCFRQELPRAIKSPKPFSGFRRPARICSFDKPSPPRPTAALVYELHWRGRSINFLTTNLEDSTKLVAGSLLNNNNSWHELLHPSRTNGEKITCQTYFMSDILLCFAAFISSLAGTPEHVLHLRSSCSAFVMRRVFRTPPARTTEETLVYSKTLKQMLPAEYYI